MNEKSEEKPKSNFRKKAKILRILTKTKNESKSKKEPLNP
jgi:hypothetical protein